MHQEHAAANGWVACHKPSDVSCVKVARTLKRMLSQKRIGHIGTLDPLATGVLTMALGEATKLIPYLDHHKKTYEFAVHWGEARDTDDVAGRITTTSKVIPSEQAIREMLPNFIGSIAQSPPLYSAIHIGGVRAYKLARRGETLTMPERIIHIYELHYLGNNCFRVTCGAGTYVRSLARDIANSLGTVGHVAWLKRTSDGLFSTQNDLWPCEQNVQPVLYNPDQLIQHLPSVHLSGEQNIRFRQGAAIKSDTAYDGWIAVYSEEILQGVATWAEGYLNPHRIIHLA